jgi:hypothetical protein
MIVRLEYIPKENTWTAKLYKLGPDQEYPECETKDAMGFGPTPSDALTDLAIEMRSKE